MSTDSCRCLFKTDTQRYWLKCYKAVTETKLTLGLLVEAELKECRRKAIEKLPDSNPCKSGQEHGNCDESLRQQYCSESFFANDDRTQWCSSICEYGKSFIHPKGYKKKTSLNDLDLNGVFSIMMNCSSFQKYFYCSLSDDDTEFKKVKTLFDI